MNMSALCRPTNFTSYLMDWHTVIAVRHQPVWLTLAILTFVKYKIVYFKTADVMYCRTPDIVYLSENSVIIFGLFF
jgi:hypothetical protein